MKAQSASEEDALIEELAAIEHARWSHWQEYLHKKCLVNGDGSLTIPAEFVEKWTRQMKTEFSELSSEEKQSDRDQVKNYWPLVKAYITKG